LRDTERVICEDRGAIEVSCIQFYKLLDGKSRVDQGQMKLVSFVATLVQVDMAQFLSLKDLMVDHGLYQEPV
jgi:hypothetical protein